MKEIAGTGKRVVDLGCGSGEILDDLIDQFGERMGLDVSKKRLEKYNKRDWLFIEADLNSRFPLRDGVADAVIANQVIEHIVDPLHFASEIHRILRKGGRCVFTTPNIRYFKHVCHLMFSGYGPRTAGGNKLDGNWDDGHLHYFTHRDLKELFSHAGFTRVRSRALINNRNGNIVRRTLDLSSFTYPVREFFSGCILLWATK